MIGFSTIEAACAEAERIYPGFGGRLRVAHRFHDSLDRHFVLAVFESHPERDIFTLHFAAGEGGWVSHQSNLWRREVAA